MSNWIIPTKCRFAVTTGGCRKQDCHFTHPHDAGWATAKDPGQRREDRPPPNKRQRIERERDATTGLPAPTGILNQYSTNRYGYAEPEPAPGPWATAPARAPTPPAEPSKWQTAASPPTAPRASRPGKEKETVSVERSADVNPWAAAAATSWGDNSGGWGETSSATVATKSTEWKLRPSPPRIPASLPNNGWKSPPIPGGWGTKDATAMSKATNAGWGSPLPTNSSFTNNGWKSPPRESGSAGSKSKDPAKDKLPFKSVPSGPRAQDSGWGGLKAQTSSSWAPGSEWGSKPPQTSTDNQNEVSSSKAMPSSSTQPPRAATTNAQADPSSNIVEVAPALTTQDIFRPLQSVTSVQTTASDKRWSLPVTHDDKRRQWKHKVHATSRTMFYYASREQVKDAQMQWAKTMATERYVFDIFQGPAVTRCHQETDTLKKSRERWTKKIDSAIAEATRIPEVDLNPPQIVPLQDLAELRRVVDENAAWLDVVHPPLAAFVQYQVAEKAAEAAAEPEFVELLAHPFVHRLDTAYWLADEIVPLLPHRSDFFDYAWARLASGERLGDEANNLILLEDSKGVESIKENIRTVEGEVTLIENVLDDDAPKRVEETVRVDRLSQKIESQYSTSLQRAKEEEARDVLRESQQRQLDALMDQVQAITMDDRFNPEPPVPPPASAPVIQQPSEMDPQLLRAIEYRIRDRGILDGKNILESFQFEAAVERLKPELDRKLGGKVEEICIGRSRICTMLRIEP